jgi:hypothetical protein
MNEEYTPVVEPITNAQQTPSPQPDWKHHFTTVTPLSRALAMLLFIVLPFVGFWVGTKYGILAQDASTITESSMNQTEQNTAGEVETVWRYSTTTEVPEGWQELKDDVLGFSISFPNHYAFSKQEIGQYGESQLAGAYTISDASLRETRPTDCFWDYTTMFTISLRNNIVTQEEIDSWGGEYSGEKQTKVNGREVWTTEYVDAVGSGVSMYVNNLENNTAININFPGGNCGITRLLEDNGTLSSVGQQILDTLIVSEGLGTQPQAAFGQVPDSVPDESVDHEEFRSDWARFTLTHETDMRVNEYGRGQFFLERDNVVLASLFVETDDGSSCYLFLCNQTTESSYSTDAGVMWEVLGITSYSDAGQAGAKITYRTKLNGKVYYVQSEDAVWAKRVVDGMNFTTLIDTSTIATSTQSNIPQGWMVFRSTEYAFEIGYPADYVVTDKQITGEVKPGAWRIYQDAPLPKGYYPKTVGVEVIDANAIYSNSLGEFITKYDFEKGLCYNYSIFTKERSYMTEEINGYTTCQYSVGDAGSYSSFILLIYPDKRHALKISTGGDQFQESAPLEDFIKTIRFIRN